MPIINNLFLPAIPLISFCGFIITFLLIDPVKNFAIRKSLYDLPNERKQHKSKIVRVGGIAIFLGFLGSYFILNGFYKLNDIQNFNNINSINLLICSLFFFLIGFTDDIKNLSPFTRLIFQFSVATYAWLSGLRIVNLDIEFFNINLDLNSFPIIFNFILTIFWIVGVVNAINWIDGLDGLAGGVLSIVFLGVIYYSISTSNIELSNLTLLLFGSLFAFLLNNFYPAKILMGDGGSYFIGFWTATIVLFLDPMNIVAITGKTILFLAFPLLDMLLVILSRICKGVSPFFPDRNHFHHKVLKVGFSERNTVILIYLINIFFVFAAIKI